MARGASRPLRAIQALASLRGPSGSPGGCLAALQALSRFLHAEILQHRTAGTCRPPRPRQRAAADLWRASPYPFAAHAQPRPHLVRGLARPSSRQAGQTPALKLFRQAGAACRGTDRIGQRAAQGDRKIVPHPRNRPQFGMPDMARDILAVGEGNQLVFDAVNDHGR